MLPELTSVKRRRKALGLTQSELARRADVSQSLITKVERGKTTPRYDIAKRIFEVLESEEKRSEKKAEDVMIEGVEVLESTDTVEHAATLAKALSVSQFPVTEDGRIVGTILTRDMIGEEADDEIGNLMEEALPTVSRRTPISVVEELLRHNRAVLVTETGEVIGIIAPEDLL